MYCLGSARASEQYGVGRYGVDELPTLGASPDAVIRHRLAVSNVFYRFYTYTLPEDPGA
jgi:hypothetical protein